MMGLHVSANQPTKCFRQVNKRIYKTARSSHKRFAIALRSSWKRSHRKTYCLLNLN